MTPSHTRYITSEFANSYLACSKPSGVRPFSRLAKQLSIMSDEKAGVYRTAYMGVVALRYKGTQVYLVPREGPSSSYV